MAQAKTSAPTSLYRNRRSFAKIPDVMDVPNLIAIQTESFEWFKEEGLAQAFADVCPIENNTKDMCVEFGRHEFGEPKYTVDECKEKDVSYQAPLFVEIRFINRETGEIKEQDVFMGDFPLMTPRGTFIINGTERVVVVPARALPGRVLRRRARQDVGQDHLQREGHPEPRRVARVRDRQARRAVRAHRPQAQAAGHAASARARPGRNARGDHRAARATPRWCCARSTATPPPPRKSRSSSCTSASAPASRPPSTRPRTLLDGLFFNPQRYDLAKVGRYKINKKLGFDPDFEASTLTDEDIIQDHAATSSALHAGEEGVTTDDIDHFGNRRIRTVGELIQNQFRIGLSRMERVVRERMSMQEPDEITPQSLVNIRPIVAAIKEFFGKFPAVPVHGPDEPRRRHHTQAPPVGPGPGRPVPRARRLRGARRAHLPLRPHVPHRDA